MAETAFPRLVIDNRSPTSDSSVSDNSMPSALAHAKNARCHLPGTKSQPDTADWVIPRRFDTRTGPPNRLTISCADSMGNSDIRFSEAVQAGKADVGIPPILRKIQQKMPGRVTSIPEQQALRQRIAERVIWLFEESGESPTEFGKRLGMKYNTFKGALSEKSFPIHRVVLLAESLNVSLDFICGITEEPRPAKQEAPIADFWELQRRKQAGAIKATKTN